MKNFFRTIVQIEIISDEPIGDPSLEEINYQIMEGDWSGQYSVISQEEMSSQQAAIAIAAQGSQPEFFGIDDSGNEI